MPLEICGYISISSRRYEAWNEKNRKKFPLSIKQNWPKGEIGKKLRNNSNNAPKYIKIGIVQKVYK